MQEVVIGQKVKLENLDFIKAGLFIQSKTAIDISCFGVDANDKLSDDRYFVFYNQKSSPKREVVSNPQNGDSETFEIKLTSLPSNIVKLVITATIDGDGDFSTIQSSYLRIYDGVQEIYRFNFNGSIFTKEKAIMVAEIYQKDNIWRLGCVAQGFNGGLSTLLKYFGGEEIKEEIKETPKQEEKVNTKAQSEKNVEEEAKEEIKAPPKQEAEKVKLSKIILEKRGDIYKIDLSKINSNKFSVNLNWSQNISQEKHNSGMFGFLKRDRAIDLDLGCMYVLNNGKKGIVQALGDSFGSINHEPYIQLDKDDRSGASKDGENLIFSDFTKIKFAVVFAFVYSGIVKWTEANGVVTVKQEESPDIVVYLNESNNSSMMCGIIVIRNENNNINIEKVNKYYKGHKELDKDFGFGFNWVSGSKQ